MYSIRFARPHQPFARCAATRWIAGVLANQRVRTQVNLQENGSHFVSNHFWLKSCWLGSLRLKPFRIALWEALVPLDSRVG